MTTVFTVPIGPELDNLGRIHYELTLVLCSKHKAFAQVTINPEYLERTFFLREEWQTVPSSKLLKWTRVKGRGRPTGPDGTWIWRSVLEGDVGEWMTPTCFHAYDAEALVHWLAQVKEEVVRDEYRVKEPPEWVRRDPRLMQLLRMNQEPPKEAKTK